MPQGDAPAVPGKEAAAYDTAPQRRIAVLSVPHLMDTKIQMWEYSVQGGSLEVSLVDFRGGWTPLQWLFMKCRSTEQTIL